MFRSKYSVFASAVLFMMGTVATLPKGAIAQSAPTFKDVPDDYWAKPFIDKLSQEEIIKGFPDGSFKPDKPVTRAQFAAIVSKAFNQDVVKGKRSFSDVAAKYWAIAAIDKAFTTGFMSGYTGGQFKPEQEIPKVQALVSLSSGLRLTPSGDAAKTLMVFRDSGEIPDYAKDKIAAATQKSLVVNYPKVDFLNPEESATRADIAAFVYQALVSSGEFQPLAKRSPATPYIVGYQAPATTGTTGSTSTNTATTTTSSTSGTTTTGTTTTTTTTGSKLIVARGTTLPVQLSGSSNAKLFIAPGETVQTEFIISTDIVDSKGVMLVPKGSKIQGRFQPVSIGGNTQATQFYAEKIFIKDKPYALNATSDPIVPETAQSAKTNLSPDDLKGGLATAAAKTVLGSILGGGSGGSGGGINVGDILGGILSGSSGSTTPASSTTGIVIVEPAKLQIKMQNDMELASLKLPTYMTKRE
jgi:hypothetical protein